MKKKYILAFDSGTTGSRAILFDHNNKIVSDASVEFPQIYPNPGWVEHNPMDILNSQLSMAKKVLNQANANSKEISAIGITNQRETSILWERATGKPIMNAIVWQDHRSSAICDAMKAKGLTEYVKENTGLVIDAYFSGTKIKWMLDNISGARKKAENGDLLFGTVDTWLIWNLTGGKVHATDYSNASRTMILNIKNIDWDKTMLEELTIPEAILPKLCPSSEIYGFTGESFFDGAKIPIAAAIGDQQSALFGQACFKAGMAKATYGTGGTMMMNTGSKPIHSESGMLTSVAWGLNGKVQYSLEGLLYVIGAAVQWLRDELKLIYDSSDSDYYAQKVNDTNGVYVVPAFVGLAAPYWDQYARGAILGLTRGANRNHIIRATLESIGYQMRDVLECMEKDSGLSINELKVDGGVSKGNFTMQFQADLMGIPILRPKIIETTARGAASLAGLATGFWENQDELLGTFNLDRVFKPTFDETKRNQLYAGWKKAVERAKSWEEP